MRREVVKEWIEKKMRLTYQLCVVRVRTRRDLGRLLW